MPLPDAAHWLTFAWLFVLSVVACSLLGVAVSAIVRHARTAGAILNVPVVALQFISGVFIHPITQLPSWLITVASLFPVKWMSQGFRYVFLPDEHEARWRRPGNGSSGRTALVLGAWCVIGLVLCLMTFRWSDGIGERPSRPIGVYSRWWDAYFAVVAAAVAAATLLVDDHPLGRRLVAVGAIAGDGRPARRAGPPADPATHRADRGVGRPARRRSPCSPSRSAAAPFTGWLLFAIIPLIFQTVAAAPGDRRWSSLVNLVAPAVDLVQQRPAGRRRPADRA